jgi:hypothetical protein
MWSERRTERRAYLDADLLGRISLHLLFLLPCYFAAKSAFKQKATSARLAYGSIATGLLFLFSPELVFDPRNEADAKLYFISAGVRLCLAIIGICMAIAAIVFRNEEASGIDLPIVGIVLCLVLLLEAGGCLCLAR